MGFIKSYEKIIESILKKLEQGTNETWHMNLYRELETIIRDRVSLGEARERLSRRLQGIDLHYLPESIINSIANISKQLGMLENSIFGDRIAA